MRKLRLLVASCSGLLLALTANAEPLLSKQEYIKLCIDTYGEDMITRSVCEQEYFALVEKEKELFIEHHDKGEIEKAGLESNEQNEILTEQQNEFID
ncbi:hypothetical protein A3K86_21355 [Photobacterium jeanii]|uniref:Uncharacterized protein n=1 Tax=Photobacterium jeanii TaxID=858640 RepID=A0A178K405_9GAMM|nr:hypothetical protein [Photobacterium jeanii]OAN11484.1 hypothetical protein A3K86_21355 [Photobacterium jeanii]PST91005.1 hypothetical protein C9I91_10460 [Photobacterium jeanii]